MLAATPPLRWLVAHHSVPYGQPWRSTCPNCHARLWPAACGPSGRCPTCATRCGAPPYLIEAVALAAATALTASGLRGGLLAAHIAWTAGATVLAFTDAAIHRLPHRLAAGTTIGFLALLLPGPDPTAWLRSVLAATALAAFFGTIALTAPRQLGLGDVTTAVPVGVILGWHGWPTLAAGVLLGLTAASAAAITMRLARRTAPGTHLPLGPYLLAAAFVAAVAS
jgi:leader peptidase (prepilin peptidase)/N-methyltransferase